MHSANNLSITCILHKMRLINNPNINLNKIPVEDLHNIMKNIRDDLCQGRKEIYAD
jgi:hypothetical protein